MLAPQVTVNGFAKCVSSGLTELKAISKLNVNNCKGKFSKTIPKALREDNRFNAYLVILNHKGRYKYMGFSVENNHGALTILENPEFVWSGYVFHNGVWYGVDYSDFIKGRIGHGRKIIIPEIEYGR